MANDERPDYFAAAPSIEDTVLRGIKGTLAYGFATGGK